MSEVTELTDEQLIDRLSGESVCYYKYENYSGPLVQVKAELLRRLSTQGAGPRPELEEHWDALMHFLDSNLQHSSRCPWPCTCDDLVNNGDHYCPIHGTFAPPSVSVETSAGPPDEQKCKHCHMPLEWCQRKVWQSDVVNRTRINYRWEDDSKAYVFEFPRLLTQSKTIEDGIASLKSIVRITAHMFQTGEFPPEMKLSEPEPAVAAQGQKAAHEHEIENDGAGSVYCKTCGMWEVDGQWVNPESEGQKEAAGQFSSSFPEMEVKATVALDSGDGGTRRACNNENCSKDYLHEGPCSDGSNTAWERFNGIDIRWDGDAKVFVGKLTIYSQAATKERAVEAVKSALMLLAQAEWACGVGGSPARSVEGRNRGEIVAKLANAALKERGFVLEENTGCAFDTYDDLAELVIQVGLEAWDAALPGPAHATGDTSTCRSVRMERITERTITSISALCLRFWRLPAKPRAGG